jgi:hypothetical protein
VSVERINYEPIPLEVVKDMALKLDEPVVDVGGSVMEE